MTKRFTLVFFLCAFFLHPCQTFAQDLDSLLKLNAFTEESDLQKELNKGTKVASGKALSTRETPGILSVISADEIQNSGARDIADVLRLVPGFDIATDVQFVTGISLRGNWAHEGKILVLLNGFQMNELLYQNVGLINHFPIDFIERIEIIRGPGSALYGGSAEYGVINIVTKSAESLNGVVVSGSGGFHKSATGRLNGGVMIGQHKENYAWDFSASTGKGIASDSKDFLDPAQSPDVQDLATTTQMNPTNISAGFSSKGLAIRGMYDQYIAGDPYTRASFNQGYGSIQYDWKVSPKVVVTPKLVYTSQLPWALKTKEDDTYSFKMRAQRYQASVNVNYELSRKFSLDFGTIYFKDIANDLLNTMPFDDGTSNEFSFYNYAAYAQGLLKTRLANVTLGFRYEKNSRTDGAFVPRLALTKKIENFHFKALYSEAFRTPSIENVAIAYNAEKVKPEKGRVFELELGYQFTPEMLFSINGFSLSNTNVIIYGLYADGEDNTTSNEDYYKNYDKTGTTGVEAIYSFRKKNWYAQATYSFAQAIEGNTVDIYQVPQTTKQYAGQLMHKFTLNTCLTLGKDLTINPSVIYGGKRYAFTDYTDEPISTKLDPYTLVNLFVNYRNVLTDGLTIGAGVYDLLNERPSLPQAYQSGSLPLPGRSREYVLRVSYQLNFKD
jgi:outer membrane cobalamin receptor